MGVLKNFKHLHTLVMLAVDVSDDIAKLLVEMKSLRELDIGRCVITGGGVFTFLSRISKLRSLCLKDVRRSQPANGSHSDKGSQSVSVSVRNRYRPRNRGGNPTLKAKAPNTPPSDAAIRKIGQMKSLESLDVENFIGISGAAFVGFPSLRHLNAKGIEVEDADMEVISKVSSIENLQLSPSEEVSEKGIQKIAKLPNLLNLHLWDCHLCFDVQEVFHMKRREEKLSYCCVKMLKSERF